VPIVIASKTRYTGTVVPPALGAEATVVEVPGAEDDYIVEGYIDLGALSSGDAAEVREYIAVDGVNYRVFLRHTFSGPVAEPVVRLHAKTLLSSEKYKVTITQTSGTLRSFPYAFVVEVLGTV